jgi:hypothetical protein
MKLAIPAAPQTAGSLPTVMLPYIAKTLAVKLWVTLFWDLQSSTFKIILHSGDNLEVSTNADFPDIE